MISLGPTIATVIAVVNPITSVEILSVRLAHQTFGKGHPREKGKENPTKETLVPVLLRPAWTRLLLLPASAITGQGGMGTVNTALIVTSNTRDLREEENAKTLSLHF
jgi:hypothetical protein